MSAFAVTLGRLVLVVGVLACGSDTPEYDVELTSAVAKHDSLRVPSADSQTTDTSTRAVPAPGIPGDSIGRSSSPQSASSVEPQWEPVTDGLWWLDAAVGDVRMSVVRIDPVKRRIWLRATPTPADSSMSLEGYFAQAGAVAGVTGGFLRSYFPALPSGLVAVNGRWLSGPNPSSEFRNALVRFDSSGSGLAISRMPETARLPRKTSLLQTGPLMILDGKAEPMTIGTTAVAERAFIATDADGRVLIGVSGPVTLPALADLLMKRGGPFGAVAAANLSGSSNAGVILRREGETLVRGDAYTSWHNVILVK